jgi:hypothetical protein
MNFKTPHVSPFLELIGVDEAVAQNQFSASVEFPVTPSSVVQGELLGFEFVSEGGAIIKPDGRLFVFTSDPGSSAGDTAITAAARKTLIGELAVVNTDFDSDSNAASAFYDDQDMPFQAASSLYLAFKLTSADGYNSSASDNEALSVRVSYRTE